MKVKICGITNIEDARICAEFGADAIGFILYRNSKRYIKPDIVKEIISELPSFLVKVGVFVNEEAEFVNEIASEVKLNIVQLHGDESPDYLKAIKFPIIKAFRIDNGFDYNILNNYMNCSFLLDSFHKKEYGGTGLTFNWKNIPNEVKNKIILAGGIAVDNLEQVQNEINPYAIDVSSSVEKEPGIKDHNKIKILFQKINEIRNRKC